MNLASLLWIALGLLCVYMAWQGLILYRASRPERRAAGKAKASAAPGAPNKRGKKISGRAQADPVIKPAADLEEDDFEFALSRATDSAAAADSAVSVAPAADQAAAAAGALFQIEIQVQQLRRDLDRVEQERESLRVELAAVHEALQTEISVLRAQLEANQTRIDVAPQYSEAMVFARRGVDAGMIAERCGISVGEAELVRSLARRDSGDEVDGGGAAGAEPRG